MRQGTTTSSHNSIYSATSICAPEPASGWTLAHLIVISISISPETADALAPAALWGLRTRFETPMYSDSHTEPMR